VPNTQAHKKTCAPFLISCYGNTKKETDFLSPVSLSSVTYAQPKLETEDGIGMERKMGQDYRSSLQAPAFCN